MDPQTRELQFRRDAVFARPFDELPSEMRLEAFGVEYAHVRAADGGDLLITRYGWPFVRCLMPENWYADRGYADRGQRLPGATGQVYRVPTRPIAGRSIDVVVKFSRVGQEVPLVIATTLPEDVSPVELANARFNSPLEEFGLVMELRRGEYGPNHVRLFAQRPLAIYAPPEVFEHWQLGRSRTRFLAHQRLLAQDQQEAETAIGLDIKRTYVLLYSWNNGYNAEVACEAGDLSEAQLHEFSQRVFAELRTKGFRVLDNKPKHFIVRRRRGRNDLIRRAGNTVYSLVDFELLQRTAEHQRHFRVVQRAKYWEMQSRRLEQPPAHLPPPLKAVRILGVNYIYGTTPNGGKLWTVGQDPHLMDYFMPDRWRRTPRIKVALTNEVYRTRTRDNIHVVYRRSRMGERPHVDPFYEYGKQLRDHGYNTPFEEVAIAEHLRLAGISTVYPRAIYRTGHESTKAGYIRDDRRYQTHANLLTPDAEPEPILSPKHEYYTIWGYFRGIDPQKHYRRHGHWGFVDVEQANEDGLLSDRDRAAVLARTRRRLAALGIADEAIADYEFLLCFDDKGQLRRTDAGELDVTWCLDALTAHEYNVLDQPTYEGLIERLRARLRGIGDEPLNLTGNNLLLSLDADGRMRRDEHGDPEVSLCNFELHRVLYCPMKGEPLLGSAPPSS